MKYNFDRKMVVMPTMIHNSGKKKYKNQKNSEEMNYKNYEARWNI